MIELVQVTARAPSPTGALLRGRGRAILREVSLTTGPGILAVLGAPIDGTSLLLDVIDGTAAPRPGRVTVFGEAPDRARRRIARVGAEAFLPEALRVDEVCSLSTELRGEASQPARDRLERLGAGALVSRLVRTLTIPERRTVSLAIAITSSADVVLVDEPLVALEPVAPRLVIDALREKAKTASIVVTTASARDAVAVADRVGLLTAGAYAPVALDALHLETRGGASMRVVVPPSPGRSAGAILLAALSGDPSVARVDATTYRSGGETVVLSLYGASLVEMARAVTRAVAETRVDVELIESATQPTDAIRAALAAPRAAP